MAAHQNFNLDLLGSTTRFEQLCYALLVHYFGSGITPYGALGPDGGIDARLDGLPGSYSFNGIPLLHGSKVVKKSGYWVFQSKYHQTHNPKTPLTDLKKELGLWKKRTPKPDYFFFITNVVFTPATHKEFLKLTKNPKPFKFFDYWDGSKLEALIAANESIRKAFFPNCEDHGEKLDKILKDVADLGPAQKAKPPSKKSAKPKKTSEEQKYITSVEELARFEGAFAKANSEVVGRFKSFDGEVPEGWKKADIISPGVGVLQLTSEGRDLVPKLIAASESQSFIIRLWHKYLGEMVEKGDQILSISYDPEDEELVELAKSSLFGVAPGKIDIHQTIDKEIKAHAKLAIAALKESDSFEAESALRELFTLRSQYIEARRKYGVGFYPNYRYLGRIGFGWSFLRVWDDAFERVSDVLLNTVQPDDLYRLVGNIPSQLAKTAIDNRMPPEEVLSELNALSLLLFKAEERNDQRLRKFLLEDIENVYEHFHDLNYQLKTLSDAEWAWKQRSRNGRFAPEYRGYGQVMVTGELRDSRTWA